MADSGWDIELPDDISCGNIKDYKKATGLVLAGGGIKGL